MGGGGGSKKCDILLGGGGPRFVTVCDRGGGSKIIKKSVTYFMDGPFAEMDRQALVGAAYGTHLLIKVFIFEINSAIHYHECA